MKPVFITSSTSFNADQPSHRLYSTNKVRSLLKEDSSFLSIIKKCAITFSVFLAASIFSSASFADTKVIGYIPSWVNLKTTIDATDLTKLTHINISFLNPNADGAFELSGEPVCMESGVSADITYVVQKAHAANVKVLISIAGGVIPACSGNWATLLTPANRQTLVDNLLAYVDKYELDGVDVDLEGAVLTGIDNAGNYTPFIKSLSDALKLKSKLLTCATATYVGGMIPTSSISYFDFVNIMSYDNIGPTWGSAGDEQSTYVMAQSNVNTWKARGLTKEQLVLGVPFYGYGFGAYESDYNFKDIVNLSVNYASQDLVGTACSGCDYITYNGLPTIRKKTQLALQEGSGIMIWQLAQDASGANSLLAAIHDEIELANTGSSSSSSTQTVSSTPSGGSSGGGGGGSTNPALLVFLFFLLWLGFYPRALNK